MCKLEENGTEVALKWKLRQSQFSNLLQQFEAQFLM